jgi:hypothetical protein
MIPLPSANICLACWRTLTQTTSGASMASLNQETQSSSCCAAEQSLHLQLTQIPGAD